MIEGVLETIPAENYIADNAYTINDGVNLGNSEWRIDGNESSINEHDNIWRVQNFKLKHPRNMVISHYNINSIRNKFSEMC